MWRHLWTTQEWKGTLVRLPPLDSLFDLIYLQTRKYRSLLTRTPPSNIKTRFKKLFSNETKTNLNFPKFDRCIRLTNEVTEDRKVSKYYGFKLKRITRSRRWQSIDEKRYFLFSVHFNALLRSPAITWKTKIYILDVHNSFFLVQIFWRPIKYWVCFLGLNLALSQVNSLLLYWSLFEIKTWRYFLLSECSNELEEGNIYEAILY